MKKPKDSNHSKPAMRGAMVVGAIAGGLAAGPVGVVAGAVVGHVAAKKYVGKKGKK